MRAKTGGGLFWIINTQLDQNMRTLLVIFGIMFVLGGRAGPVLNSIPITFQMSGQTTYTPDAGGVTRTGYKLQLGYSLKQWLAVEIKTGTTKQDVLVLQINDFYTTSSNPLRTGHQVSVEDFYRTDNSLNYDQITTYDISSYSYSQEKAYSIDMIRYTGSNSNQDWNAAANKYSLTQVCFYTSNDLFSMTTWMNGFQACYYFEIDNYVSSFKGTSLKSFYLNGYSTGIYGWIDGPYVSDNLYFFHQVPLYSYSKNPAMVVELGTTSGNVGQDFHVFSPIASEIGDYFGTATTDMAKDTTQSGGYENGGLTLKYWNTDPAVVTSGYGYTAIRASFSRNISTYDKYDRKLLSTFIFCLYLYAEGTINSEMTSKSCEIVELSPSYTRMEMPVKWGPHTAFMWCLALLVLLVLQ